MVNATTYMVAATVVMLGVNALGTNLASEELDIASVAEDSASSSELYRAAIESILEKAASARAENKIKDDPVFVDNLIEDIIADFRKFLDRLLRPTITLPSVDMEQHAEHFSVTPKELHYSKRAIYDMDGNYSESPVAESETSNAYSAQDASASESYPLPSALF